MTTSIRCDLRVAVVTGGARGIGRAVALRLAADGFAIVVNYLHRRDAAASVCDAITSGVGGQATAIQADVSDLQQTAAMFARIRREVGTPNVLVNSAGINDDQLFPLMRNERWWRVINTNLGSVVNCCRCVLPPMISRREGVIVNISSVSGHRGRAGQTAYSASKAAIDGFSRSLAQEVTRYGIIVNCLAPGFIATDMVSSTKGVDAAQLGKGTPIGRIGRPEEVAELVSVLASRRASYVVGQVITIDGGGWT